MPTPEPVGATTSREGVAPRQSAGRLALVLAGPVAVALACWFNLTTMTGGMSAAPGMATMAHPMLPAWPRLLGLFVMWLVMMAAMMLPTALPMIGAYARMRAAGSEPVRPIAAVALFAAGYVATWSAYSLAATALQAVLSATPYFAPMAMKLNSPSVAGAVLIAAGAYQWSPWKDACLGRCRSPIAFLMTEWRDGRAGALIMGWRHGLYCVGCCWALMALLFVTGVMNLVWIVALAGYTLLEKIAPQGTAAAKVVGAALVCVGLWMMLA